MTLYVLLAAYLGSLLHAVNSNELQRFCFWHRQSVVFCLSTKYLRNHWKDLCQIHTEDVFGPSLGWVWRSRSKVKVTRNKKMTFFGVSVVCVQFMFG